MPLFDMKALRTTLAQIEQEKKIPQAILIEAIESALSAAYKKDFGKKDQIIQCNFNLDTGDLDFFQIKTIVNLTTVKPALTPDELIKIKNGELTEDPEDERPRFNSERHIMIEDARRIRASAELGEEMLFPIESIDTDFGRVAAQTAKQVIMQRLREAERDSVMREYSDKEGQIVTGIVQRYDRGNVYVDLGRAIGIIAKDECIEGEFYRPGQHIKVFLYSVNDSKFGVSLRLSRAHPVFIEKLFALESPEIANGVVEIKSIAREPGARTKIAVATNDPNIDPIGACVGQKGSRVNAVTGELSNEKIDIIPWSDDTAEFIANSLSPARAIDVTIDEDSHVAHVTVSEDQLSLAIGRGGQNARLAARLTGWKVDIQGVKSEAEPTADEYPKDNNEETYTKLSDLSVNDDQSNVE